MTDGDGGASARVARRVTAADVARAAGVSRVAVSRSFTPGASVAPATRDRVIAAAASLGYRPNALARQLNGSAPELVAFVAGFIDNYYYASFIDRLLSGLQARGRRPLYVHVGEGGHAAEALARAAEYPVACTIVAAGSLGLDAIRQAMGNGPVVLSGPGSALPEVDAVFTDGAEGIRLAVLHLVARGRRRLACITGPEHLVSARERGDSFRRTVAEAGVESLGVLTTPFTVPGGTEAARRLLASEVLPDAIVCGNDAIAIGVLNVLKAEAGLAVPEDIAVTGFDDTAPASWPLIGLTSVGSPVELRVGHVCDLVDRRLAAPDAPPRQIRIEPHLVVRTTS
ncbi:LacI family DNA-binding transcriptional regulator [Prosthecomicrobium sp. N25]|uniref:LacI family DNA-binding transcriptional regulator n=1 Tax=Prosthecomicrobium sp. N25 TaxID=3129254 RepID=UPI003076AEC1